MSILFGHPTGNPNSHHAALAHLENGRLDAFCVPWMPSELTLRVLQKIPGIKSAANRLQRRRFEPLDHAHIIQGRIGEVMRLIRRQVGGSWADERINYEANDWLMHTMASECKRKGVRVVHAYEDCSLLQFQEAKRRDKACVYDMPIGYFPWWENKQSELVKKYIDYLPKEGLTSSKYVRVEQKKKELQLADLVLVPSHFVETTIRDFHPDVKIAHAPYGVDLEYWHPNPQYRSDGQLQLLFAGQIGIRKGIPVLLEAWQKANLKDARLDLVGMWNLSTRHKDTLPTGVTYHGLCSKQMLRTHYHGADAFVFPSFFEGFALSVLEAMGCGLPIISTEVLDGMELIDKANGILVASGDVDQLVHALRQLSDERDSLPAMKHAARSSVERFTWERYRRCVGNAVSGLL